VRAFFGGRVEPDEPPAASTAPPRGGRRPAEPPLTAADFGLPATVDLSRPGEWLDDAGAATAPTPAAAAAAPKLAGPAKADAWAEKVAAQRPARHVLLCAEPREAKCAPLEAGRATWEHLKRRVKELGLDAVKPPEGGAAPGCVLRTQVNCLRVCADGPIAVVYPDGIWYRGVRPEVMERILLEHVLGGRPVAEHVLARIPLGADVRGRRP
jgi:(2Fe-2S) ferredoxin